MLFPGSRIWYEGSAADLASLTDEIKQCAFSGHIVLEFQESLDVVVCVGGDFVKVIEKIGRRLLSTKKYREIWGKCQIKPGRMLVFELPPRLATRLRALQGRRLLASGTTASGLDPARLLDERRGQAFTGILDAVSPEGKLLLDYEAGTIVDCWYTEHAGITREGLAAFTAWHRGFVRSEHPSFFFLSERGGAGESLGWDEILMDYADQVPLPLATSIERLMHAFGAEAADGEPVYGAGSPHPGAAVHIVEGGIDLYRADAQAPHATLGPGHIVGLELLFGTGTTFTGRARGRCRYLPLDRGRLPAVFANSPSLSSRLVRDAARMVHFMRGLHAAYAGDPRLRDVEQAIAEALDRQAPEDGAGVAASSLFRELTQLLPLSLPEIDALYRRLLALGVAQQTAGRVTLAPVEL